MKPTLLTTMVISLLVAAGCGSEPVGSEAPSDVVSTDRISVNQRFPITRVEFNSCEPAEAIAFEGFLHVTQHGFVDPASSRVKTRMNIHASGIGAVTGSRYQLAVNLNDDILVTETPTGRVSDEDIRMRLIRQGSEDDFVFESRFRLVCDDEGCRIEESDIAIDCRG